MPRTADDTDGFARQGLRIRCLGRAILPAHEAGRARDRPGETPRNAGADRHRSGERRSRHRPRWSKARAVAVPAAGLDGALGLKLRTDRACKINVEALQLAIRAGEIERRIIILGEKAMVVMRWPTRRSTRRSGSMKTGIFSVSPACASARAVVPGRPIGRMSAKRAALGRVRLEKRQGERRKRRSMQHLARLLFMSVMPFADGTRQSQRLPSSDICDKATADLSQLRRSGLDL